MFTASSKNQIEDLPPQIDNLQPPEIIQPRIDIIQPPEIIQPQMDILQAPEIIQPQFIEDQGVLDLGDFDFGGLDEFDHFDIWNDNRELPPVEQVETPQEIRDPNRSRTTKWRDLKRCKETFDRETIAKAHGDLCGSLSGKKVMQRIDRNPDIADAALKYIEALDAGDGMYT